MKAEEILNKQHLSHALPAQDAADFKQAIDSFLLVVEALHKSYRAQGKTYFNVTIKCHYLAHIADFALQMSPRAAWCYAGESFMNTTKKIVSSCVHGTTPMLACSKATSKFVVGMAFTVFGHELWK